MASSNPPPRPTLSRALRSETSTLWRLLKWWPLLPLLVLFLAASFLIYQTPGTYVVNVGDQSDEAYTVNFHTRLDDNGTSYRWSDVYGYVLFPGMGGGRAFTTAVLVDMGRTAPLQIFVNGAQVFSSTLTAGWKTIPLPIDEKNPAALASRDTVIEFRSTDYRTEDAPTEPKGVKVDGVAVSQEPNGGIIWPPISPLLWFCVSLALAYVLIGRTVLSIANLARARLYGLLALLILAGIILWTLAQNRISIAADAGHIAATLITVLLIAVVLELVLRTRFPSLTPLQCRLLASLVGLAFLLRFGGMALPQSVIVDMPYHMKWLRTLLTGDWQSLYFPGGLSAVPREWGLEILIPKSPLFYAAFAPLSVFPFDLETSTKWLVSLLDASVVLAVFSLARRAGLAVSAALFSAALYAVMPLVFRAFAYGILPTIFAQWLAVLLFVAVLGVGSGRARILAWFGVLVLTTLVLLSFPTVALFVSIVIVAYALVLLFRPQMRPAGLSLYSWLMLGVLILAWGLSLWAYYGLYISPVFDSISALLAPKAGQESTVKWPGGFPDLIAWSADYVVTLLPLWLAVVGFVLLLMHKGLSVAARRAVALLTIWMLILPVFFLANYKVDMIGKHLFFTMVPVAVAGGVALFAFARRGRWGAVLAGLAVTLVAWQGLVFWIARLVGQSS